MTSLLSQLHERPGTPASVPTALRQSQAQAAARATAGDGTQVLAKRVAGRPGYVGLYTRRKGRATWQLVGLGTTWSEALAHFFSVVAAEQRHAHLSRINDELTKITNEELATTSALPDLPEDITYLLRAEALRREHTLAAQTALVETLPSASEPATDVLALQSKVDAPLPPVADALSLA